MLNTIMTSIDWIKEQKNKLDRFMVSKENEAVMAKLDARRLQIENAYQ